MKNTLKSVLSFTLAIVIFFSFLNVNINAEDESLSTKYENLEVSCSGDGLWSGGETSFSGSVSGSSVFIINTPRSGTLTFKNNKVVVAYISFNYNITVNTGSVTIGEDTVTNSGTYSGEIAANGSLEITITSGKGTSNTTAIDITDIFYKSKIIYTDEELVTNPSLLIADDVDYVTDVAPTYLSSDGSVAIYGTGTVITAVVGGETYTFTLVVDGDLNGDSVCDVLDVARTANCSAKIATPTQLEIYAATGSENATEITVEDYMQIVNKAVG